MSRAILFIDGNNFYHNLKASKIKPSSIDFAKLQKYICDHFQEEHVKTIYYNSVPDISQGDEVYYNHMRFLSELKKIQKLEVKTRKLQSLSTQETKHLMKEEIAHLGLCELCRPIVLVHWEDYIGSVSVKEKGVDMLIGVDMIKLCLFDKECDTCILLSGDADFIPAMDLVKNHGKKAVSAALAKGYSFDLRNKHGWFIIDKKRLLESCSKQKTKE